MRQYSILHGLFLSFGSRSFYRDVAANWRGAAFILLLLLAFLIALQMALFINQGLSDFDRAYAPGYIRQLPTITIDNGEASTPQDMPYMITEPSSGRPVIMIDTTREHIEPGSSQAMVFISRTQIAYRRDERETRVYELSQFDDMVVTQESAHQLVDFLADWLGWILAPFIFVGVFMLRVLLALVYAVFGLVMGAVMKVKLPYDALVSLAMVTAAPAIVAEFVINLFANTFNIPWLLGMLINLALLGFAIYANKPSATDYESTDDTAV